MTVKHFDAISSLSELKEFLKTAAGDQGSLQTEWRGRKVCVGDQRVSERVILKKFTDLEKAASSTDENVKETALCERFLRTIVNKKTHTPWYIRLFQMIFRPLIETPTTEKDLIDIEQIRINSPTKPDEKQKAERILKFVKFFGDDCPKIYEEICLNHGLPELAQCIINHTQFNALKTQVAKFYAVLPEQKASNLHQEVAKILKKDFVANAIKALPNEDQPTWKTILEYAQEKSTNHKPEKLSLSKEEITKLFQSKDNIKKILHMFSIMNYFSIESKDSFQTTLMELIKDNSPEIPRNLTQELINRFPNETLSAEDKTFASQYLINFTKFDDAMSEASPNDKPKLWKQASKIISDLFKNEDTKYIAIQLLRNIKPPQCQEFSEELGKQWSKSYWNSPYKITDFNHRTPINPFSKKIIANREWYKDFENDILRETILVSMIEDAVEDPFVLSEPGGKEKSHLTKQFNLFLRYNGMLPDDPFDKNTANSYISGVKEGIERGSRNFVPIKMVLVKNWGARQA